MRLKRPSCARYCFSYVIPIVPPSADMKGFRDILIKCLEEGTLIPDKTATRVTRKNLHSKEFALKYGFLIMDFFCEDGMC